MSFAGETTTRRAERVIQNVRSNIHGVTVTLAPIPAGDVPALRDMWELYVQDFIDFVPRRPGPDGRLESDEGFARMVAPPLELLWIRIDGRVAGFVFIRPHSHIDGDLSVSDVAQFFVLASYRRAGVGRAAAARVFTRRPGRWEVREMAEHLTAQRFWRRAISEYTGGHYSERQFEKAGALWVVQSFTAEASRSSNGL
jgi:predicted acetyltransferase